MFSRRRPAIYWWAALGLLFLGFELILFVLWFASGDAKPTESGTDEVSHLMRLSQLGLQVTCVVVAAAFIVAFVVLPLCRDRRLSNNGL